VRDRALVGAVVGIAGQVLAGARVLSVVCWWWGWGVGGVRVDASRAGERGRECLGWLAGGRGRRRIVDGVGVDVVWAHGWCGQGHAAVGDGVVACGRGGDEAAEAGEGEGDGGCELHFCGFGLGCVGFGFGLELVGINA
jgi:hypothetical protein